MKSKCLKIFLVMIYIFINQLYAFDVETISNTKVVSVADGDTITVTKNDKVYKVRLLGIQAPEVFTTPIWPYGLEAKKFLNELIYNKYVDIKYVKDNKMDKYNRILGIVYLKNQNINLTMIQHGYAFVYIIGKTSKIPNIEEYINEENKAIASNINIWSDDAYKIITPKDATQNIGKYKIIDAHVYGMSVTPKGYWLYLGGNKGNDSLSIRISHKSISENNIKIDDYKNKNIRIRGYIDRYSTDFSPFVNFNSKNCIEIQ